jgi:hypothetical protein
VLISSDSHSPLHLAVDHGALLYALHVLDPGVVAWLDGAAGPCGEHAASRAALLEEVVDVLHHQLVGLGEEAVHDGHPAEADDGEDNDRVSLCRVCPGVGQKGPGECVISLNKKGKLAYGYAVDGHGGDLHDGERAPPVDEAAEGVAARADARGGHLAGVEQGDGQPADAEEDLEDEDEGGTCVGGAAGADGEHDGGHGEAEAEAPSGEHEQRAPPESLDGPERDVGRRQIRQTSAAAVDQGDVPREAHRVYHRDVVVYLVRSRELLHDVHRATEAQASEILNLAAFLELLEAERAPADSISSEDSICRRWNTTSSLSMVVSSPMRRARASDPSVMLLF